MLPIPGQRIATYEELSSTERVPYLSAVVYEILRVSGTASAVTRDTQRDTTILGHPVPKGTNVMLAISYTQRYESMAYKGLSEHLDSVRSESSRKSGRKWGYWDDEDCAAFRPERWLTADGVFNPNAGPWMPFSFGFRGCFGQKLAVRNLPWAVTQPWAAY
jgi:cytochrome P450